MKNQLRQNTWSKVKRQLPFQLMVWPGFIFLLIFAYGPMFGLIIAFQDYRIGVSFLENPFVGLAHFKEFLSDSTFWMAFKNTVQLSLLKMFVIFPLPIILALALNELPGVKYKKIVQTCSYFPHFISYVVVATLWINLLDTRGLVNNSLLALNVIDAPIEFWTDPAKFKALATIVDAWKTVGWSAIIYFAAITGVNAELYESARIDGAGRFAQIWYITLPSIMGTVIIMFLLSIGGLVSGNLDISRLLGNAFNKESSYIVEYYVLDMGLGTLRYSFATAVGLFQSLISVSLVIFANIVSKKASDVSMF